MKGIILELKKEHTIIITKDGDFKKILTEPGFTHIGQEVQLPIKKQVTFTNHLKYAVSFLIFILLFTFYFSSPSRIYAYVTIGKNPSLELAIDRHQKVLSISALSNDAKSIIKDLDYKNHTIIEVVQSIAAVTIQKKYIKQNSNQKFVITTVSRNPNNLEIQKLNASITAAANNVIQNKAQIISQNTTFKKHKQALKKRISAEKTVFKEKNNSFRPSNTEPTLQSKSSSTISKSHHKKTNENDQKNPVNKVRESKKIPNSSKKNKRQSKSNHSKK